MASSALPFRNLKRTFVTPEGVDLQLELGSAGSRAGAFMHRLHPDDVVLVVVTFAFLWMAVPGAQKLLVILWLIGFFVLRNGWFSLFEMGSRGATPGKRLMGLRVVARDGARLTGAAVIARNAMREIEVFLPLVVSRPANGRGNRGHLPRPVRPCCGAAFSCSSPCSTATGCGSATWSPAPGSSGPPCRRSARIWSGSGYRPRRIFPEAALGLYGIYELQTLEQVLRNEQPDAIATVARTIREKAGLPDDGDDFGFLSDYYAALCVRLEAGLLVGRRRESKFD